jgi:hypothetical protein
VNLMLAVLMTAVGFGLLTRRFGRFAHAFMAVMAIVMTALYYFTNRFM